MTPHGFRKIDASGGAVFFASGVFYYFLTEQVKALVQGMADAFPGSVLVFDAANRTAVKMIAKTWLKSAKSRMWARISRFPTLQKRSVRGTAVCRSPAEAICWATMTLKGPSVSGFFRFLAKVGDGMMKMQIVKIRFGGK